MRLANEGWIGNPARLEASAWFGGRRQDGKGPITRDPCRERHAMRLEGWDVSTLIIEARTAASLSMTGTDDGE